MRVALDTNRYVDLCKGLDADDQTTHHYASIFRQLRKQGTPIPTNDMWLAALVLRHNG